MTMLSKATIAAVFAAEFQRRAAEDARPCRDLVEILIADQDALDAYRANLGDVTVAEWPDHSEAEPSWLDQNLINQIVRDGLAGVPDEVLPRLFRDVEALFTLQVEVQMKAALRTESAGSDPWFWESRIRPQPVAVEPEHPDPPTPTEGLGDGIENLEGLIPIRSEPQIRKRVNELILAIRADYAGRPLMIVPVLTGGCFFAMDLYRGLATLGPRFDPIVARSYIGTDSGRVRVDLDMLDRIPFAGQHVLIVDDILDTGQTLTEITRLIRPRGPSSVRTCVLLRKVRRDRAGRPSPTCPLLPDYIGFDVPDVFMVGYGLDYEGSYRELRGVYELPRSSLKVGEDQGIRIRIGGQTDPRPRALSLSWLEVLNRGPEPIEAARLTIEFCVRRGWTGERNADDLHCETVQELYQTWWNPGETLRAAIDRPDLDELIDRVHISLESVVDGELRSAMTGLTRDAITQNPRIGSDPGSYFFEQFWPLVPTASEYPLGVV